MPRRNRSRGEFFAAEIRELVSIVMGVIAAAGGALIVIGILATVGLLR